MTPPRLDHIFLRVPDEARMRAFFCNVVGLCAGPRPPFGFAGSWLYAGEQAVVHLAPVPPTQIPGGGANTGVLGHVAFRLTGLDATRAALEAGSWRYQESLVPLTGEIQLFVPLPGNLVIELVFDAVSQ